MTRAGLALLAGWLSAGAPAEGAPVGLERHRGTVVVLNFWASWCQPCREEMPLLARIQRAYGHRGVQVLGASIDEPEDRADAERFVRESGVEYPVSYGHTTEDMMPLGLASSIPATAVYDRDGTRAFRIIGEVHEDALTSRLEWLLGERAGPPPPELVLPQGVTPEHFGRHERGEEEDEDEHHAGDGQGEEGGSAVPT